MIGWTRGAVAAALLLGGATGAHATFVVGTNSGATHVKVYESPLAAPTHDFFAYPPQFTGGVSVAVGDLTGDGAADVVTGAGPGGGPHVKAFDGSSGTEVRSFFAYDAGFVGGVNVAAGDVNGDGLADIVTGTGAGGGPHVKVFDGTTGNVTKSFFAFDGGFQGGVRVASGDVNGDGRADLITGTASGAGQVRIFDGVTLDVIRDFNPFGVNQNGLSIALGRFDGVDALFVGAGEGSLPVVNIYSLSDFALLSSSLVFDPTFLGGVSVAGGSFEGGDGLYVGTLTGRGDVAIFDTDGPVLGRASASFQPFGAGFTGGVNVAAYTTPAVPEPATWAMMLAGFGLIGTGLRSRPRSARHI